MTKNGEKAGNDMNVHLLKLWPQRVKFRWGSNMPSSGAEGGSPLRYAVPGAAGRRRTASAVDGSSSLRPAQGGDRGL